LVPLVKRGISFGIIGRFIYTSWIRAPLTYSQCPGYSLCCRSSWREWVLFECNMTMHGSPGSTHELSFQYLATVQGSIYRLPELPQTQGSNSDVPREDATRGLDASIALPSFILCSISTQRNLLLVAALRQLWDSQAVLIYPWNSPRVLVPLIIGLALLSITLSYEANKKPFILSKNRTSLLGLGLLRPVVLLLTSSYGYVPTVLRAMWRSAMGYYLPVYFQTCKLASPLQSGIDNYRVTFSATPAAIAMGASISILHRSR